MSSPREFPAYEPAPGRLRCRRCRPNRSRSAWFYPGIYLNARQVCFDCVAGRERAADAGERHANAEPATNESPASNRRYLALQRRQGYPKRFKSILAGLTPKQRQAVELHLAEPEPSISELARRLGIDRNSVRRLLAAAYDELNAV